MIESQLQGGTMVSRVDIAARKETVRKEAAARWAAHASQVAATAEAVVRVGPVAAATPERRERYLDRESRKATFRAQGLGWERMIGPTLDFDDLPPTTSALEAGKPVARIVELLDTNRVGEGFATGFLVSGGLLMTNWHVFGAPGEAVGCAAQFGFERTATGLIEGGTVFELDPGDFFYSSKELDFVLVAVRPAAVIGSTQLDSFRSTRLIPSVGKILAGQPVSVIQHPEGSHKRWAVRENKLVREPADADLFLEYTTDTLPGSSGSPAFNKDWELVAVHHSGVPRMLGNDIALKDGGVWRPGVSDSEIDWVANEGVRVSKIHADLSALAARDPARQSRLSKLLAASTDPVATGEMRAEPLSANGPALWAPIKSVDSSMPMNVVVNGTANFYMAGKDSAAVADVGVERPRVDAGGAATPSLVEKKLRFDAGYQSRPGYDPNFLPGFTVPAPKAPLDEVLKHGSGQKVLRYHHFSLVMHKDRRLCMWAASNVNYDESKRRRTRDEFGSDTWKLDPRILGESQIEDAELYEPAKKFDRGHIVRRDDVAWGDTAEEEEFGNSDSFHFTNCTPQHEQFNRAMFQFHGLWGELEKHITKQAGFLQNLVSVFAGPVLAGSDPKHDFGLGADLQIPIQFWKVIVAVENADTTPRLRSYGFLLSQQEAIDQWGWENRFRAGKFREWQVSLARITAEARVEFPQVVLDADPFARDVNESGGRTLRSLADVRLR
jgi:endonuclease G, mitochondrial